jgi:uncharacterized protein (DUF2062 family)
MRAGDVHILVVAGVKILKVPFIIVEHILADVLGAVMAVNLVAAVVVNMHMHAIAAMLILQVLAAVAQ